MGGPSGREAMKARRKELEQMAAFEQAREASRAGARALGGRGIA